MEPTKLRERCSPEGRVVETPLFPDFTEAQQILKFPAEAAFWLSFSVWSKPE